MCLVHCDLLYLFNNHDEVMRKVGNNTIFKENLTVGIQMRHYTLRDPIHTMYIFLLLIFRLQKEDTY